MFISSIVDKFRARSLFCLLVNFKSFQYYFSEFVLQPPSADPDLLIFDIRLFILTSGLKGFCKWCIRSWVCSAALIFKLYNEISRSHPFVVLESSISFRSRGRLASSIADKFWARSILFLSSDELRKFPTSMAVFQISELEDVVEGKKNVPSDELLLFCFSCGGTLSWLPRNLSQIAPSR